MDYRRKLDEHMDNVYIRLSQKELERIQSALCEHRTPGTESLISKMDVLTSQMQPGTMLTLEAVAKKNGKCFRS